MLHQSNFFCHLNTSIHTYMASTGEVSSVQCTNIHNIADSGAASEFLYSSIDKIILQIIIPSLSVVGVVGNCGFLFMILRLPKMRTSLSAYLACLAVSDVLFLVMANIWYSINLKWTDVNLAWPTTSAMGCAGLIISTHIWYFVSVGLTTLISMERYQAVCHPLKHVIFQGKTRNMKILLATWLLALIMLILTCSYVPRYTWYNFDCFIWPETEDFVGYPYAVGICGSMDTLFNSYEAGLLIVVFLISALGNGVLYFKIIVTLSGRDILQISDSSKDTVLEISRVRNQVARALVINGIIFSICQISSRIDNLDDFCDYLNLNFDLLDYKQEKTVTVVGHTFLFLNSIINPYIYVLSCQHYRQGIVEVLGGKKKNSSQGNNSGTNVRMFSITNTN